jgi:hypothetical protein
MPDDNQQNDNLASTADAYRRLDPAAFEDSEQLTDDQVADVLIGDSYGDEEYGYPTAIEAVPGRAEEVAVSCPGGQPTRRRKPAHREAHAGAAGDRPRGDGRRARASSAPQSAPARDWPAPH